MKRLFVLLFSVLAGSIIYAQPDSLEFKLLRYDEDYSMLKNDTALNWYEKLKYSPLTRKGKSYVSFGGDIRYQYYRFRNEAWGAEPKDEDGFLLARFLTHAHFYFGKQFKGFLQIQSSLANGKHHTSPVDENLFELHQAFFDVPVFTAVEKALVLRVGRQELLYGSQRIISVREGPNTRQSFDGIKFMFNRQDLTVDLFYTLHVESKKKFWMIG